MIYLLINYCEIQQEKTFCHFLIRAKYLVEKLFTDIKKKRHLSEQIKLAIILLQPFTQHD